MLANNAVLFAHIYNMLRCIKMLANNAVMFAHIYNMLAVHKNVGQQCCDVCASLQHVGGA